MVVVDFFAAEIFLHIKKNSYTQITGPGAKLFLRVLFHNYYIPSLNYVSAAQDALNYNIRSTFNEEKLLKN